MRWCERTILSLPTSGKLIITGVNFTDCQLEGDTENDNQPDFPDCKFDNDADICFDATFYGEK